MFVNFRLKVIKVIQITGQRKAFCRPRIPEFSGAKKGTVEIDILVTCRNSDKNHAIYQNNEQTSLEDKEVEPGEPVQMNIYQSNVYVMSMSSNV